MWKWYESVLYAARDTHLAVWAGADAEGFFWYFAKHDQTGPAMVA